MPHYMIDLETMGTKPDAPITSIGAVEFSLDGIHRQFYEKIDLSSSVDHGGVIDPETVKWWLSQEKAAQKENMGGGSIVDALHLLSLFMSGGGDAIVWGNGAAFDNVILAAHYDRCKLERPWKFWNDRCYRTMKNIHSDVSMDRLGVHHNALDDAISQANHLIEICTEKGVNI